MSQRSSGRFFRKEPRSSAGDSARACRPQGEHGASLVRQRSADAADSDRGDKAWSIVAPAETPLGDEWLKPRPLQKGDLEVVKKAFVEPRGARTPPGSRSPNCIRRTATCCTRSCRR